MWGHHIFGDKFANTTIPSLLLKEQGEVCLPWELLPFSVLVLGWDQGGGKGQNWKRKESKLL